MGDDEIIVTTSERRAFKRCQWRWWMAYREGLRPKVLNHRLWFGIGIHEALAVYYQMGTKRKPKSAIERFVAFCDEDELSRVVRGDAKGSGDSTEWIDGRALGIDMLTRYHREWNGDRNWDVIFTEHPFRLEIPGYDDVNQTECIFASTFDGVYRDKLDGLVKLMEHKTAQSISILHLEGDEQASSYFAAATLILRDRGVLGKRERIDGVTYNFLRKAIPSDTRPQNEAGLYLNKDGSISKSQPPPFFAREFVDRKPREALMALKQIQTDAAQMNHFRDRYDELTKNHNMDCHWDCPFYNMCLMHDQGGEDWEYMRNALYSVADPYRLDYRKSS